MTQTRMPCGALLVEATPEEQEGLRTELLALQQRGALTDDPDIVAHQWELANTGKTVVKQRRVQ